MSAHYYSDPDVTAGILKDAGDRAEDAREEARQPFATRLRTAEDDQGELATLDISAKGVRVLSTRPYAEGQRLTLLFFNGTMRVEGVVSRIRTVFSCDWEMGITFLKRQNDLIAAIRALS